MPAEVNCSGVGSVATSALGLGTAPLGGLYEAVADDRALATVAAALAAGVTLFDTAPLYGHGLAERRLGAALRQLDTDGEAVVSTKVGRLLRSGDDPHTVFRGVPPLKPVFDFSRDGVLRSLHESLDRLGRDGVDIVFVHDPDDFGDQAVREAIPALIELREQGVVRAIGAGMNQSEMLARFVREADVDCVLLAGRFTLLDQSACDELLPLCRDRGVTVVAGGVFNSGVLADPSEGAHYDYAPAPSSVLERARRAASICADHSVPLRAAAARFPSLHPAVGAVLIGARTPAELEEAVAFSSLVIPPDLWDELREAGVLRPETAEWTS